MQPDCPHIYLGWAVSVAAPADITTFFIVSFYKSVVGVAAMARWLDIHNFTGFQSPQKLCSAGEKSPPLTAKFRLFLLPWWPRLLLYMCPVSPTGPSPRWLENILICGWNLIRFKERERDISAGSVVMERLNSRPARPDFEFKAFVRGWQQPWLAWCQTYDVRTVGLLSEHLEL